MAIPLVQESSGDALLAQPSPWIQLNPAVGMGPMCCSDKGSGKSRRQWSCVTESQTVFALPNYKKYEFVLLGAHYAFIVV